MSNELGAAHPATAKFSVLVATVTSFLVGLVIALVLIIARKQYPNLFSNSTEVKQLVYSLTVTLGINIVINSIQPTLSGMYEYMYTHIYIPKNYQCFFPFFVIKLYLQLCTTVVGVAIGAGWQAYVAYVNVGCYYFFGIPLGLGLGYAADMGVSVLLLISYMDVD